MTRTTHLQTEARTERHEDWQSGMDVDNASLSEGAALNEIENKEGTDVEPDLYSEREDSESVLDGSPPVTNPSTDILLCSFYSGDFESVLETGFEVNGCFAASRIYDDAPNPIISSDGMGLIGLPLNEVQARTITRHCDQPLCRPEGRRAVHDQGRCAWEMDASRVQIQNPTWITFIQRILTDACKALGVDKQASQPRCDLQKLTLYETGSSCPPRADIEGTNGIFAAIVIVLPSPFTGGDAHLSHCGMKSVFNSSKSSVMKTTVLSWYAGVKYELKPITSGYRLALVYNLVHTTTSPYPALSSHDIPLEKLRHILLSWKQNLESGPTRIIYILSHKYKETRMSGRILKGKDAQRTAALDLLAKQLGFHLGLAHLEHGLDCAIDYDSDSDDYRGGGRSMPRHQVDDEWSLVMNLVSLEGELISEEVDFADEGETIPASFSDHFKHQKPDGRCTHEGNGSFDLYYRRTVLVIWPPSTSLGNGLGDRRVYYALECLDYPEGPKPSLEEEAQFSLVCRTTSLPKLSTLETLASAACFWRREDLWHRALDGFGDATSLTADETVRAIEVFGLAGVMQGFRRLVKRDRQNQSRFTLISAMIEWCHTRLSEEVYQESLGLLRMLKSDCLDGILTTTKEEIPVLLTEVLINGGIPRLAKGILSQLIEKANAEVLQDAAIYLHEGRDCYPSSEGERALLKQTITDLLRHSLAALDLFQIKSHNIPNITYSYMYTVEIRGSPAPAAEFVSRCLDSGNEAVAAAALERMIIMDGKDKATRLIGVRTVLLPLLPLISKDLNSRTPRPTLSLGPLSELAIQVAMEDLAAKKGRYSREDFAPIIDAAIFGGIATKLPAFSSSIIPKVQSLPWHQASWESCLQELHARREDPAFISEDNGSLLTPLIDDMAHKYALQVDLPNLEERRSPTFDLFYFQRVPPAKQISKVMDLCLRMGSIKGFSAILGRVISQELTKDYISEILVPLVAEVIPLAKKNRLPLISGPVSVLLRKSMDAWVENILGPRSSESASVPQIMAQLKRWTCDKDGCDCARARQFLITGNPEQRNLRLEFIGAPARKHLEAQLKVFAPEAASFTTITTSPQGLIVTKASSLIENARWNKEQARGKVLLNMIGDDDTLRQIWGVSDFDVFAGKVQASPPPTAHIGPP